MASDESSEWEKQLGELETRVEAAAVSAASEGKAMKSTLDKLANDVADISKRLEGLSSINKKIESLEKGLSRTVHLVKTIMNALGEVRASPVVSVATQTHTPQHFQTGMYLHS